MATGGSVWGRWAQSNDGGHERNLDEKEPASAPPQLR